MPQIQLWAGVHDPLSALLADRAGYDGLWLSSFGLSASYLGARDEGHLSPADLVDATRRIAGASSTPIVVDIENGYGHDPQQSERFLHEIFQAGARGVCVEDTLGQKECSLYVTSDRVLRPVPEMARLITQMKRIAEGYGGIVLGRTEALIEDMGVEAATERCSAYAQAGADAVVPHFRRALSESVAVAQELSDQCAVVVIPTKHPELTTRQATDLGFSIYIGANLGVRAAAKAMEKAFANLRASEQLSVGEEQRMGLEEFKNLLVDAPLPPSVIPLNV